MWMGEFFVSVLLALRVFQITNGHLISMYIGFQHCETRTITIMYMGKLPEQIAYSVKEGVHILYTLMHAIVWSTVQFLYFIIMCLFQ